MLTVGIMSAFMNNIGAVAILLPAVMSVARRTDSGDRRRIELRLLGHILELCHRGRGLQHDSRAARRRDLAGSALAPSRR
mgnify:CR=1 FL=1